MSEPRGSSQTRKPTVRKAKRSETTAILLADRQWYDVQEFEGDNETDYVYFRTIDGREFWAWNSAILAVRGKRVERN